MNSLPRRLFCAALAFLGAVTLPAQSLIQDNYGTGTATMPGGVAVSSGDLLQTHLTSATRTGAPGSGNTYFYREDSGYTVDLGRLSDGAYGTFGSSGLGGNGQYTVMPNNVTLTFTFDTAAHPAGYSLSSLRTFASWDSGRDGQAYSVKYSTADNPLTFLPLITITTYNNTSFPTGTSMEWDDESGQFIEVETTDESIANTLVQISASSGYLVTNVAALQFVFSGHENGGTAYREIDVFGVASIPEPGALAALLGAIALGVASVARRRQR